MMTVQLPFEHPDHPLDLPRGLKKLQQQGPIHRIRTLVGDEAWLVTGYSEVRLLLDDRRLGWSHPDPASAARASDSFMYGGPIGNFETELTDHQRMRELLHPLFSPGRAQALRGTVEVLTTQLLDQLEQQGPPADLQASFANLLPVQVICELLGVPVGDRAGFEASILAASDVTDRTRSERGLVELYCYGQTLAARKRQNPEADVVSALCAIEGLTDETVVLWSMMLLFAAYETVANRIGSGALFLLTHPEHWSALLKDPGLMPDTVEDILCLPGVNASNQGGMPRYARTNIDIGGITIQAGDLVLLSTDAANQVFCDQDPTVAPSKTTPAHLTFGYGFHRCIGNPLARLQLDVALSQLVARFPKMRLTVEADELTVRTNTLAATLNTLPVAW
jgi:pentalenolactone synthase